MNYERSNNVQKKKVFSDRNSRQLIGELIKKLII